MHLPNLPVTSALLAAWAGTCFAAVPQEPDDSGCQCEKTTVAVLYVPGFGIIRLAN